MTDTLAARRRPAEERMEQAAELLRVWRLEGYRPQVGLGPARVECALKGEHLPCPSCLLPELLWLLRDTQPIHRDVPGLRWADSGGGAA